MALVAGADGCPAGWICVTKDLRTGAVEHRLCRSARDLIYQHPEPTVLMVDAPIGLPDAGVRACDAKARRRLGKRHVCVFSAPIRPSLFAGSRSEASEITQRIDGRKVGCQAFNIVAKIRELDELFTADSTLQERVFEVHPELSFAAWNGGEPLASPKKSTLGKAIRRLLIGAERLDSVCASYRAADVGVDDAADAFAALWTAERKFYRQATVLPDDPPRDRYGLRMEIWY